ncbi:MAG: S49 family peptidase [Candidatus Eisenbacteria bacterium]|uniref:S49 family peptidase n=1 Tax=Eiseniibacteriota bacterium TaxID=2212470 RepID=A0A9D6L927_UNCEI|nr:S49 family peptidase [Candidatus Eisenbacteria bacterium]
MAAWLACAALPVAAGTDAPLLSGHESVAAGDDATGFLINPAAGGLRYPDELLLTLTDFEPSGRLYRGAWVRQSIGLSTSIVEGGVRTYGVTFHGGTESMRAGLGITTLRAPANGGHTTDYAFGLLAHPRPWFAWGAVADHLTRPSVLGVRFDRDYRLGVAVRPLAILTHASEARAAMLTLSADVADDEHAPLKASRLRFGAEIEPVPGLLLRGSLEDHGGFRLGIGLLGVHMGYHGSRAWGGDDRILATTHAVSLHSGEDRTVLAAGERRIAVVPLAGVLGDDAIGGFSILDGGERTEPVRPIHETLERALRDPRTRGVLLELGGVTNMAQLEELRPRIARLREAGKPVVAYLEAGGGRGDLYLASACDRVFATDEALFEGLGLRAERRYYRGLLAEWGVRVDRSSYGRYKSAYRNFSADSTSPADREAIERSLDVSQELFVSAVAADRRMDRARLLAILDGRHWSSADLEAAGLIDSVGYREQALATLGAMTGLGARPPTVDLSRAPAARRAWATPSPIAVVYAAGAIDVGESGGDLLMGPYMGSATVTAQLERAFRRPDVRAVVLRVESPGGSGLASNLIDHAVQRLKRETRKPLIVSMGSVAASGGYYIAAHGDAIFADRYTRTGSIGVLTIKPSFEGWYAKHGVREDDFERGRYMRGTSFARDWDAEIQAHADSSIFDYYRGFVAKVAEGRGLAWAAVDSVAQGRVWMGEDARDRRLVDAIGGLEAAVAEARRRARVPEGETIRLAEYRRPQGGLLARLIGRTMSGVWARTFHLPAPGGIYYLSDEAIAD